VTATISGDLSATMHLVAGYDTAGLRELVSDPQHRWTDVFDGFFIDTAQTMVTVSAGLAAGAALDLLVASGGVEGGLFADVTMRLHDPDKDGKMRWSELLADITTDPLCLFEVTGKVTAKLYAWYQFVGGDKTESNLVNPITLITFNDTCPDGGGVSNPSDGVFPSLPPPVGVGLTDPDGDHLALSAPAGSTFSGVHSVLADGKSGDPPAPDPSLNVDLPVGAVSFTLGGLLPGATTVVSLRMPQDVPVNSWWKYGHEHSGDDPHWWNFTYDPATGTGAKFSTKHTGSATTGDVHTQTTVTLFLKDGARGDDDLTANGVIVDPGAPGFVLPAVSAAPYQPSLPPPAPVLPSPNERYVTRVYQELCGVPPAPATLAALGQLLDQGVSRFRVVLDLLHSPDYCLRRVQRLYRTLLHRSAGRKEMEQALRFLTHGGTLAQLEALLLASGDYFQHRGGGTGAGFLEALSEDLLGQPVNPGVVAEFGGLMADAGARLRTTTAVLRFAAVDQRWVQDLFQRFMHRAPSARELRFYTDLLQRGSSEERILAALLS
jgi:hypothetical protein